MATLGLSAADDGSTTTVTPGGEIAIRLDETPTTGFRWEIDVLEGPLEHIDDAREIEPDVPRGAVASASFGSAQPSQAQVISRSRTDREWEGDASIIQRFSVIVNVT